MLALPIIEGCSDSNYQNGKVPEPMIEIVADSVEPISAEYIIVLVDNASLEAALQDLQSHEVVVIRDLERGRYLIEIKDDPGVDRLQGDVEASVHLQAIHPNFTYTTQ